MLIVRICGGLGNQMFQYAFGRYLSFKHNKDLLIDASFFKNKNSNREIGISKLNVHCKISLDAYKTQKYFKNPTINKYFNYFLLNFNIYSESKVSNFKKDLLKKNKGYFDGYWQTEKYFYPIRDILIEEFKPKHISLEIIDLIHKIQNTNSISLHIRKADYLYVINSGIYANCSTSYYMNSINLMLNKFSNAVFYIFTDDLNWVNNNLNFTNIKHEFVSKDPIEDLYIMSKCKHNIISNSTFSWWSAWLNEYSKKVVIAPLFWFTEKSQISYNIVPDSWIRIANE